jgi:membrane glycosyltransferase
VARGLAAWQGGDGNYWGHNAIIRTAAFAACCGLPDLPGKQPLGGPILSHDFVEAALMRRAGWRVEMATDLGGSWEESPPSLIAAAARDRRWAQGNLQHLKVIAARGLTWPSRVHLAIGIMSYCASPIWLLLIVFGFALSLQANFVKPEYFPEGFQLFPTWPLFDSERMTRLFVATMGVLLLPKAIGLVSALGSAELRRGAGGGGCLMASALVELVLSALYAPIMMVIHSRHLYEILAGRDSGWSPQRRDAGETRWAEAWQRHRWHMATGLTTAAAAWFLSPMIMAWLSPCLIGLVLAAPLSRASGSRRIGEALWRMGLLATPEEHGPPRILQDLRSRSSCTPPLPKDGILALATDGAVRDAHFRWARPAPRRRGAPDAAYLTAAEKIAEAETLEEALAWLDASERVHVAGHPALVEGLLRLPSVPVARPGEPQPPIRARRRRDDGRTGVRIALAVLLRSRSRARGDFGGHPA